MNTRRGTARTPLCALFALVLLALGAADARADAVTVTLVDPFRYGLASGSYFFQGTLTNNTASAVNIGLITQGNSVGAGDPVFTNLMLFPFTLNPFETVTATLFRVDINTGVPGQQTVFPFLEGSYTLFTGNLQTGFVIVGAAPFVVSTAPAAVPEPATLTLLAAGLAGAGVARRRRTRDKRNAVG